MSDLKENALHWCQKFIGGSWNMCTVDKLIFTPVKGALTNYIYTCELHSSIPSKEFEHRKVLLRIYGEISGPHEKFCELLIFNILSERKLGPKLLGAFKNGRIEEYKNTRPMTVFDIRGGKYLKRIAERMAKYHLLDMPLNKKPNFLSRCVSKYLQHYNKALDINSHASDRNKEIMTRIVKMNIHEEYQMLLKKIESMNCATVFCHNDVQEGNLLVYPNTDGSFSSDEIMLIDFEYSYYGYRGFDIGNHFCEWVMQNSADTRLGFDYDFDAYPTHEQQLTFAHAYLKCISDELESRPELCREKYLISPEDLIKEANVHSLMSHLFWGFWGFAQYYLSHIEFDFLEYSIVRFELYFKFKEKFSSILD